MSDIIPPTRKPPKGFRPPASIAEAEKRYFESTGKLQDIELQLGTPVQASSNDLGGVTAVYDYEVGNEPSAGRAIGHGVADLLTLGAWELVGTPVEAVQGDKYRLTIAYDKDNKAKTISSQKI